MIIQSEVLLMVDESSVRVEMMDNGNVLLSISIPEETFEGGVCNNPRETLIFAIDYFIGRFIREQLEGKKEGLVMKSMKDKGKMFCTSGPHGDFWAIVIEIVFEVA